MVLTAAGIVLSLLSASATLLDISPAHNFADEQEIAATVEPEERSRTLGLGVSPVDGENPPGTHPCDGGELISFEGFPHDTILAEQYSARGVHISAEAPDGRPDAVVVFDSGASGTFDPNLEIGIGKLAVIAKDVADENGDGRVDFPDNGYSGGTQVYTFDRDREVLYIVYVDVDTLSLPEIKTFDAGGAEIAIFPILAGEDGSLQTLEVGAKDARRLEITYRNSGALAEICLDALS